MNQNTPASPPLKKTKMKTLELSSQSPGLNSLILSELLWRDLKKVGYTRKPAIVAELQVCKDEWAKISPRCSKTLITSYRKHLIAVVPAKGGPTSYVGLDFFLP